MTQTYTLPMQQMPLSVPQQPVQVEQPDPRVRTLSTGVVVKFGTLPTTIKQSLTVNIFQNTKMKNGQLITNQSTDEQFKLASKIMDYHSGLISWGVTLVGDIDEYIAKGVVSANWENKLVRSNLIEPIENDEDREFAFLRYIAFADENDWAMLGEMLMTE